MKRFMVFVTAVLLCFAFAACGSTEPTAPEKETTSVTEQSTQEKEENNTEVTPVVNSAPPQIQDIRDFLAEDEPFDVTMGTFGSMDFMYSLEKGQEDLIQQYMDTLFVEEYGLTLFDIQKTDYESATFKMYYFMYSGEGEDKLERENMDWDVSVCLTLHKDTPTVTASVNYVNGFELVDDGHRADYSKLSQPTPTPKPVTTPAPTAKPTSAPVNVTVDKNAAPIADFSSFLLRFPSEEKDRYYGGYRKYYQNLPLETQQTVVSEVLTLLGNKRYQLELIEKLETDDSIIYNYRYTGNVAMDMIHSRNDDKHYYNLQFTVFNKNNHNGHYSIHFHYAPQFVAENAGYTVSANVSNVGGISGGSSDGSIIDIYDLPDHSKLQCLTCHGDGDCTKCGGSTYIGYGSARAKCDRCHGSGNCTRCGGTGTRG